MFHSRSTLPLKYPYVPLEIYVQHIQKSERSDLRYRSVPAKTFLYHLKWIQTNFANLLKSKTQSMRGGLHFTRSKMDPNKLWIHSRSPPTISKLSLSLSEIEIQIFLSGGSHASGLGSRSIGGLGDSNTKSLKHSSMISFGGALSAPTPTVVTMDPSLVVQRQDPVRQDEISDQVLYSHISAALLNANLDTLTKKQIREDLSVKLGVDLKGKKQVMNAMIDDILLLK